MVDGMRNTYYIMDLELRQTWGISPMMLVGIIVVLFTVMNVLNRFIL